MENLEFILQLAIIIFQIFELYCVFLYFKHHKYFKSIGANVFGIKKKDS